MKAKEELVFVRDFECTEPVDEIYIVLRCAYYRSSPLHEVNYFIMKEGEDEVPKGGEQISIERYSSTAGRASVLRGNHSIKKLTYSRHWDRQKLYATLISPDFENAL